MLVVELEGDCLADAERRDQSLGYLICDGSPYFRADGRASGLADLGSVELSLGTRRCSISAVDITSRLAPRLVAGDRCKCENVVMEGEGNSRKASTYSKVIVPAFADFWEHIWMRDRVRRYVGPLAICITPAIGSTVAIGQRVALDWCKGPVGQTLIG